MNDIVQAKLSNSGCEEKWLVLVLYEGPGSRDRALALCDRLVKNFWSEVEFDFRWWRQDFLNDPGMAEAAAADAREADIFIFSSDRQNELSPALLRWFEEWASRRETPEGMFLDLTEAESLAQTEVQLKQACLKSLASRAHLDYFNRVPPRLGGPLFDSWQNVEARTHEVTAVLDDILKHLPPPTHYGLNE